jgi:hypothetical protein
MLPLRRARVRGGDADQDNADAYAGFVSGGAGGYEAPRQDRPAHACVGGGRHGRADLLPVGYFHLVFTLPAEIAPIAYQNKSVVYDLLFRTSSETLLTIAADPKHLGAGIGIAVLHTWGSAMTQNPHS